MLSVAELYEKLLTDVPRISDTETVILNQAVGRVLAADVVSSHNVPPHDNSAMDGYALRHVDATQAGAQLQVTQRIPAGSTGVEVKPGEAARIFTGAPIPPGATAVLMQEDTSQEGDTLTVNKAPGEGENIRRLGEDITAGNPILSAGHRLRPQDIGLCASVGIAEVTVYRRLKVALFSTGDELVEPGDNLGPGQIYNSNRYTLSALLQTLGCDIVDLGMVEDTLDATKAALINAAGCADVIVTSGGVSVGEEDHLKPAVESLGSLDLWRIAMKPGKPLAYGQIKTDQARNNGAMTPFIGLPGNPVSAFATFVLFGRPYLLRMQNMDAGAPTPTPVTAGFAWPKAGSRQEYLRAQLRPNAEGQSVATLYPKQGSGVLTSTSWADGFVIMPIGQTVKPGDTVDYLPLSELLS